VGEGRLSVRSRWLQLAARGTLGVRALFGLVIIKRSRLPKRVNANSGALQSVCSLFTHCSLVLVVWSFSVDDCGPLSVRLCVLASPCRPVGPEVVDTQFCGCTTPLAALETISSRLLSTMSRLVYNRGGPRTILPTSSIIIRTLLSVLRTHPLIRLPRHNHSQLHYITMAYTHHLRFCLLQLLPCLPLLSECLRPLLHDRPVTSRERLHLPSLRAHPRQQPPGSDLLPNPKSPSSADFGRHLNNHHNRAVLRRRQPNTTHHHHEDIVYHHCHHTLTFTLWRDSL
jgi:hypothetical protein